MINWDQMVGTPCTSVFGQPVQYTCQGGPTLPLTGNWTEGYVEQAPIGEGPPLDTTDPVLGVQYSAFQPYGKEPLQGDTLSTVNPVSGVTENFVVKDVQPDGQGTAYLLLNFAS
jgi:hypothetical protein